MRRKNRLEAVSRSIFNKLLHKIMKGITRPEGFCMLAFTARFSESNKKISEEATEHVFINDLAHQKNSF
jgi:hypothetical protein